MKEKGLKQKGVKESLFVYNILLTCKFEQIAEVFTALMFRRHSNDLSVEVASVTRKGNTTVNLIFVLYLEFC
jgi:hypothetical protein